MTIPTDANAIDPEDLLRRGHALVTSGEHVHGLAMVKEAVELDPTMEHGWLLLSDLLDDPVEQADALAKALALNPTNTVARRRLDALRQPVVAMASLLDEPDIGYDSLQCLWCGEPTLPENRACPHCGKSLMVAKPGKRPLSLNQLVSMLAALVVLLSLVWSAIPLMAANPSTAVTQELGRMGAVQFLFTDFLAWPPPIIGMMQWLVIGRALGFAVLFIGWLINIDPTYWLALLIVPFDMVSLIVLWWLGLVTAPLLTVLALLDVTIGLLVIASNMAKAGHQVRQHLAIQHETRNPRELLKLGQQYMQAGKVALATLYWQRSTMFARDEPAFHYQLGMGYLRLGRNQRALQALHEAKRLAPNNARVDEAIRLARARGDTLL